MRSKIKSGKPIPQCRGAFGLDRGTLRDLTPDVHLIVEDFHGTPIEGGPDAPNGLVTTGNIIEPPRARIFTLDEQAGHHAQAFLANPAIGDAG